MKTLAIVLDIVSGLMLFFTVVCGLWISTQKVDASAISFHMKLGLATVVVAAIAITTLSVLFFKK